MKSRLDKVRDLRLDAAPDPPPPSRRWGLWLFVLIAFGIAAVLAFRYSPPGNSTSQTEGEANAGVPAASAPVTSLEARAPGRFTAAGYVEPIPPFPMHVSPLVLGRIDEFAIVEGAPVEAGQVIARLNSEELRRRRAELRAALDINAQRLSLAASELARSKKLAATGATAVNELEQASTDAAVLRAEAAKLRTEIETVEWRIEQADVRAPTDGVLFERLAHVGDTIYADSKREIASIYDPAKLQIWVDVNQRDAARLHVGQPVEVALDAEPGRVFTGEVLRILPRASLAKNTIQAKIRLRETSPSLRPDMSAKVTFLEPKTSPLAADQTTTAP